MAEETLVQRLERIDRRLDAVEDKQDEVIHLLQTAGGELQTIGTNRNLSFDNLLFEIRKLMVRVGGELKGIRGR